MRFPPLLPRKARAAALPTTLACAWTAVVLGGCGRHTARDQPESTLSADDRTMLQRYEALRATLAQDDYRTAKRQATGFEKETESATPPAAKPPGLDYLAAIAGAATLDGQREAFRTWSKLAIERTKGVEGFYVIHCPLPGCGDWVQRSADIDNPFMGKAMHDCGEVQR